MAPAVPRPVQAAIPAEVTRAAEAEVRIRPPPPDPRRDDPRPADVHRVDVGVRGGSTVGAFVDVLVPVRHPHPAVLGRVDPLARRARRRPLLLRRRRRRRALRDPDVLVATLLQDPDLIVVVSLRTCGRRRRRRRGLHVGRGLRRLRGLHRLPVVGRRWRRLGLGKRNSGQEAKRQEQRGSHGGLGQWRYQSRLSRIP